MLVVGGPASDGLRCAVDEKELWMSLSRGHAWNIDPVRRGKPGPGMSPGKAGSLMLSACLSMNANMPLVSLTRLDLANKLN